MAVSVLSLFLTVPWVALQCVIVAFPGHTYLFLVKHQLPMIMKMTCLTGIFLLSEVWARGPVELGKRHLNHQNWENFN